MAVEVVDFRVGLAIVDGPGADVLASVMSKALAHVGIVHVSVANVKFASMLAQATKKLSSTCDGVIGLHIVEKDAIGCGNGSNTAILMSALFEVGIFTDKPVIPGIICQSSLLEAKGILPNLADEWAQAMLDMISLSKEENEEFGTHKAPEAEPFAPPVPEEEDYAVLLDKFRETLKVRAYCCL